MTSLTPAQLHWTPEGTPYSPVFSDIYFHRASGILETREVFLSGNGLPERWQNCKEFTIAETGFGTGLNFLCTCQCWLQTAPADAMLHFISIEKFPLTLADLQHAHIYWPELTEFSAALHEHYPPLTPGTHTLQLMNGRITLTLLFGDIAEMLPLMNCTINAWFLDGFAPGKNPEMWSDALFRHMKNHTAPDGTFSTFTAAATVRNGLESAGFSVEKLPGFGQKRHRLQGSRRVQRQAATSTRAMVIGAGLAGTAAAYHLARAGWDITLIERAPAPAIAASGNPAALVMPGLTADHSPASQFYTQAFLLAKQDMQQLPGVIASWGGITHLPSFRFPASRLQTLAAHPLLKEVLALSWDGAALHYENAGWANPGSLCRSYIQEGILTLFSHPVATLRQHAGMWEAIDEEGEIITTAETIIIASAYEAAQFPQTSSLPLRRNRGQITYLPADALPEAPLRPLCYDGYIIPHHPANQHCIGATFDKKSTVNTLRTEDHWHNIRALEAATGQRLTLSAETVSALPGRVAFRTTSPDHLPMVGAIPGYTGLYVTLAHGARGMISAPLAGYLLAGMLTGQPLPIEESLASRLDPGRFLSHR